MALLISAAGAGDQSAYGAQAVENLALGISATAGAQTRHGRTIISFDGAARNLAFEFADAPVEATLHVSFYFGDGILAPNIGAGDQSLHGAASVENVAQGLSAQGIGPGGFGGLMRAHFDLNGANIPLDLTEPFIARSAQNVGFYFGGQILVSQAGLGELTQFGEIEDIDQPFSARPDGIPSPGFGNNTLAYPGGLNGATVHFDFTEPAVEIAGGPVRLDFSPNLRPITEAGGQGQALHGNATVENAAQGIFAQGIDSLRAAARVIVYEDIGVRLGARLGFQFVQGYEPPTAQNVPFQFIVASGFGPVGFGASLFGAHSLVNTAEALYAEGFDAAGHGTPEVYAAGADQPITTQGFDALQFGQPLLSFDQSITPPSVKVDQYGVPILIYTQVTEPFGFDAARYNNLHKVRDKAELLQTLDLDSASHGFVATAFGTQRAELFNRPLPLTGYAASQFGAQRISHQVRELRPTGFDASRYGAAHRVDYRVRFIDQIGLTYAQFGQSLIYNFDPTQTIEPPGLLATVFGGTEVENFIRYLFPEAIESTAFVSRFFDVANYDREVRPFGHFSQRMGTPFLQEIIDYPLVIPGQDHSAYGTQAVYNLTQIAVPTGFLATAITNFHEIANDERGFILPGGFLHATFGANVSVRYGQFFVDLLDDGIPPGVFGQTLVGYGVRRVFAESFDAARYGEPELENAIRPPLFVAPIAPIGFGTAGVTFRVRGLGAASFRTTTWGIPTAGFHQEIAPQGHDAALFGGTEVRDNSREVRPFGGIPPGLVAPPGVSLFVRRLLPPTLGVQTQFPRGGLELHRVRNNWQFVRPFTDTATTWGPYFGSFNLIENRNRIIRPNGFNVSRVSTPQEVRNTAIPIRPLGLAAAAFGTAMVADAIRFVRPDEIFAFPISNFHALHNDARVIQPFGFRADFFGTPEEVRNANRFLGQFFPYVGPEAGTPFVADRIRTLNILFGIEPPFWPLPTVFNLEQVIRPVGYKWPDETGAHNVRESRNIIAPRWQLIGRFGFATVRNLTPELGQQGRDHSVFGLPSIRLEYRFVAPAGALATLPGKPELTRGIRFVGTTGIRGLLMDRFHRVDLGNPELPFPQRIEPVQIPENDGAALRALIGTPSARTNVLASEGFEATKYGNAGVFANSIFPKGILLLADKAFGTPSLAPPFTISPDGLEHFASPKQRVSPHTIWCRFDAPAQARANHINNPWQFMDYAGVGDSGRRPFFGRPAVTNQNREIRPRSHQTQGDMARYGAATVIKARRFIRHESFRPLRVGVPFLLGGQRGLTVYGFEIGAMGDGHRVAPFVPPDVTQFVTPEGVLSYRTGAQGIELLNRAVTGNGINVSVVQRPAVSRSPRFIASAGFDATQYGVQWVSNFIRFLEPVGDDLSQMEYGLGFFNSRMRVRVRNFVTPTPEAHTRFGASIVGSQIRGIQQTEEIARGAAGVPSVSRRNIVALGGFGFDASAFGDVDRWEHGVVKPHGDDLARSGTPMMVRVVQAGAGDVLEVGESRVGRKVEPLGFETLRIGAGGGPALVNPHGCGTAARGIFPSSFDAAIWGSAAAAN